MGSISRDFKVIDTDTHVIEPYDLWTSRISVKKFGDLVPHVKWDPDKGEDSWYFGDRRTGAAASAAMAGWHEYPPDHPRRLSDVNPGTWRAEDRLKIMDDYGIYAQVLYPNLGAGGFGAGNYVGLKNPELMRLCVEAYNDWLSEFSSAAPKRFIPMASLPFWDIDEAIAEMNRAAKMGHKGIVMIGEPEYFNLPKLTDPHWDRFWAATQDLELAVNFHVGTGDMWIIDLMHDSVDRHAHFASMGSLFSLNNANVIAQIVCGGVCHRFPKLNFVSVESGVGWAPFLLDSLDYQWKNCGVQQRLPGYLLPSEYIKRQVYFSFWFERDTARTAIEQMGADNILYETDFPHPTSMSPGPATSAIRPDDFLEIALKGVPRDQVEKIVYSNAARIYHLED
jgi:predicted TIM-barrel fold metal-dependent hydrolase